MVNNGLNVHLEANKALKILYSTRGGSNFILFFWNFNRNHTENDRYWQKNNFLFFAKCLKMYSFFLHLHFQIAKSAIMTQNIFFLKNINMGVKKRRILCWFQIRWCRLKQMPLNKARAKKLCKFKYFRFCAFFRGFLLLTFFWVFVIPILIIFPKSFFGS